MQRAYPKPPSLFNAGSPKEQAIKKERLLLVRPSIAAVVIPITKHKKSRATNHETNKTKGKKERSRYDIYDQREEARAACNVCVCVYVRV